MLYAVCAASMYSLKYVIKLAGKADSTFDVGVSQNQRRCGLGSQERSKHIPE